jgi:phosphatidylserine decarboxylase
MRARLFVSLQHLLPQHGLSRLTLRATRVRTPWFKNALMRGFMRLYDIDMSEALESDPVRYGSFNEFFTRALKSGARPIAADPASIACPVDGTVSECGRIEGEQLMQAKGRTYALNELLAAAPWSSAFAGGEFATIYLAPYNYHRIHMPLAGKLLQTIYVPGRLFSVNTVTAARVPRLFARNERVICLFEGAAGRFAVILVGALNVGSMSTVWAGDITPAKRRIVTRLPDAQVSLGKGEELGRFNMGSTVILLLEPNRAAWRDDLQAGLKVRLGEELGRLR